ncbi:AraC family transcriptional regulator [Paraburkholderia megapolitana]|uniref:AraC family transcriptional regulator n=1 Tax=Paraburkholderia megapolitana TaxID=420953 RepID=UPI0038B6FE5E
MTDTRVAVAPQSGESLAARRPVPLHTIIIAVRILEKRGVAISDLLAGTGISPDDLKSPQLIVTHLQELMMLSNALSITGDESIGLAIGRRIPITATGARGHAMLVSETLGSALRTGYQFPLQWLTYFRIVLHEQEQEAVVTITDYTYRETLRVLNTDTCIAAIHREISNLINRNPSCIRVTFDFPPPKHAALYEHLFDCKVVFNAATTTLVFKRSELETPLPMFDEIELSLALELCEQRERELGRWEPSLLVPRAFQELLGSNGTLSSAELAEKLNLSHRQMQRELEQAGTSYRLLRDEIRKILATEYQKYSDMDSQKLASILGYSSTFAFHRAQDRWMK